MTNEDVCRLTDAAFLSLSKSLKEFHYRVKRPPSTTLTTEDSLVIQPLERLGHPLFELYVYNENDLHFARSINSFADFTIPSSDVYEVSTRNSGVHVRVV